MTANNSSAVPDGLFISAATKWETSYVFHSGTPNELCIAPTGVTYRGKSMEDVEQVYRALSEVMNGGRAGAAPPQSAPVARGLDLQKLRQYLERTSEDTGYGFYRPPNPHDFCPDGEMCSDDEIAAHKAACEAYDKGEYTPERGSEWVGKTNILRAPWGMGSYTLRDPDAVELIAQIDATLSASSIAPVGEKPVARLQADISDRPYSQGESIFEIVILDRARCADGMLLYAHAAPITTKEPQA